jgi:hypothetical protein
MDAMTVILLVACGIVTLMVLIGCVGGDSSHKVRRRRPGESAQDSSASGGVSWFGDSSVDVTTGGHADHGAHSDDPGDAAHGDTSGHDAGGDLGSGDCGGDSGNADSGGGGGDCGGGGGGGDCGGGGGD